jgi:hypothetical protein
MGMVQLRHSTGEVGAPDVRLTALQDKSGSIKPTAMERTLTQLEREHRERGQAVIRCADVAG